MEEEVNPKRWLYAWFGRQKIVPNYDCKSSMGKKPKFTCEVRVPGYDYVAIGVSSNKKDAATNAAKDFISYLIREEKVKESELPSNLTSPTSSFDHTFSTNSNNPMPSLYSRNLIGNSSSSSQSLNRQDFPRVGQPIEQDYVDRVAQKRKFEEAEELDVNSGIHGNWTLDNCKQQLHAYAQSNHIKLDYKYSTRGPDHNRSFMCELSVFVRELGRNLVAHEHASNKQLASRACALSIMRQLFHYGVIKEYTGNETSKKKLATKVDLYSFPFPSQLIAEIRSILKDLNYQCVKVVLPSGRPIAEGGSDSDQCCSLLPPHTVKSQNDPPLTLTCVNWCPPVSNWDAWRCCNIDEPPLCNMSIQQISQGLHHSENERRPYISEEYKRILADRRRLPVWDSKDYILKTIAKNPVVIIQGSTGCGKTTQIPQFILDSYLERCIGGECNIIVSQPRRISAVSIAERLVVERCESFDSNQSVGYSVRFETVMPRPYGAILFCTVGVLLRKLENGLRGISHVIIDEVHERDVNTDFLLVVIRDMVNTYPKLRVILMSATIDTSIFQEYFGGCPIIEVPGRLHPVTEYFLEDCVEMTRFVPPIDRKKRKDRDEADMADDQEENLNKVVDMRYSPSTRASMEQLNEREISFELISELLKHIETINVEGSVLIFLPGWNQIFSLVRFLESHPYFNNPSYRVVPLHSQIPREEQRKAFAPVPKGVRKVILSTNIAETSITIDDVVFVIDTCKMKIKLFTSHNNMTVYNTDWASKTNLAQRKGRAGRVRPGFYFCLCSRARYEKLEEFHTPEIFRTPLHELALMVKLLRLGGIGPFLSKAIEPPPIHAIIESEVLLRDLKALDENSELTSLGRILARLPVEPRLGKMLVLSCAFSLANPLAVIIANSSTASEPFDTSLFGRLKYIHNRFRQARWSDHMALLNSYLEYEKVRMTRGEGAAFDFCERFSLMPTVMKMTHDAKNQLLDLIKGAGFPEICVTPPNYTKHDLDLIQSLLTLGYYPNVCLHKEKRKVLTTEAKVALMHKTSVNFTGMPEKFQYPFFVFGEKLRTRVVSCKQLSMISPIHLILFGSNKVDLRADGCIQIDRWIDLEMDAEAAAAIAGLRPAIEDLILKISENPEQCMNFTLQESRLLAVVKKLSSFDLIELTKKPPKAIS